MVVSKYKVLQRFSGTHVCELLLEVTDAFLQSKFLLTIAAFLLELVAVINVLGDFWVCCRRSNDLGGLEEQPKITEVEVKQYHYDDWVVDPHSVKPAAICWESQVGRNVQVYIYVRRKNVGVADFLPSKIAWDVEEEVLIVRVDAVYCDLGR